MTKNSCSVGEITTPKSQRNTFYVKDQYPDDLKPLVVEIILEPGFFREMIPVPGAIDALVEMQEMGFEVFICSSPCLPTGIQHWKNMNGLKIILGPTG